ncbi:hypothetical protein [Flammeovirga sp. SJP92]|uniref:hypothetical protein n=1 Tax=Flammeovirga sp. SJP92 TaxID=1775430 RepID=UPI0007880D59|nr:hypothetical protein [Flammeovirga sp. SJP92]KXX66874.1 hypothetical protein AVL50_30550 [Flammeovirga sp. SJP92]
MKRAIFILIVQLISILAFGQDKDLIYSTPLLDKYVNRCIDSLEPIEYLKINDYSKEIDFCNLASCLTFLEAYDQDSLLNQAIYERLRQIAQVFYNEGTPILLLGYSMNSVELSESLNMKENPYGITYISLGNSCLSFGSFGKGVEEFNKETILLVKYQVPNEENPKKKKKSVIQKNKNH